MAKRFRKGKALTEGELKKACIDKRHVWVVLTNPDPSDEWKNVNEPEIPEFVPGNDGCYVGGGDWQFMESDGNVCENTDDSGCFLGIYEAIPVKPRKKKDLVSVDRDRMKNWCLKLDAAKQLLTHPIPGSDTLALEIMAMVRKDMGKCVKGK